MVLLKSVFVTLAVLATSINALPRPLPVGDAVVARGEDSSYGSSYGGSYGDSSSKEEDKMPEHKMEEKQTTTSSSHEMKETSTPEHKMEETTSSKETKTMEEPPKKTEEPKYGSGKSNWDNSGYDDCVQKCIATYGAPPATYKPTATAKEEGSKGTGSTVTVIVAPTKGVLRYVPAAVNATVGTTIKFMWGAGPHTVTKSSSLLPCNKSGEAPIFASGQQEKDFVFTQVVNDTKPAFFMCGVPEHCQKGMFGMINPPNSFGAPSSVAGMSQGLMASNPDLKAYASYTANNTQGKTGSNWGSSINLADMPDWAQPLVLENVMFTRNLLAMNPDIVKEDGSIDLGNIDKSPLMIPQDVKAQLNAAGSTNGGAAGAPAPPATPSTETSAPEGSGSTAAQNTGSNGASALASPKVMVAVFAIAATLFAL